MRTSTLREEPVGRRTLLGYVIGAVGAFIGTVLAIPLVGYIISPALRKPAGTWVEAGSLDNFQIGTPRLVEFAILRRDGWMEETQKKSVWVVRRAEQDFTIYNPRCTHLGCAYNWVAEKQQFFCPCHAGVFDIEGNVVAGPPPRPLDRLPFRVENGKLLVQYVDFRLGIPDKVEA